MLQQNTRALAGSTPVALENAAVARRTYTGPALYQHSTSVRRQVEERKWGGDMKDAIQMPTAIAAPI